MPASDPGADATSVSNVSHGDRLVSAAIGLAMVAGAVPRRRWVPAITGAALLLRAGTGYCPLTQALGHGGPSTRRRLSGPRGTHVKVHTRIGRPPAAVYAFWRRLDQLALALPDTLRVQPLDEVHSQWTVLAANGMTLATWTAECINDLPERLIAWRTSDDSAVVSAGSVQFEAAPAGRGTDVRVHLQFAPPLGRLGAGLATLSGHDASRLVQDGLDAVKRHLENRVSPSPT
jgi:uncharacterized membrane protein